MKNTLVLAAMVSSTLVLWHLPLCAAVQNGAASKTPIAAKTSKLSRDPCAGSSTEVVLLACRRKENKDTEVALARLTEKLDKNYASEPERANAFSVAGQKWGDFRDAECKLLTYESRSGTAAEVYWLDCLTRLGRERIDSLKKLAENP